MVRMLYLSWPFTTSTVPLDGVYAYGYALKEEIQAFAGEKNLNNPIESMLWAHGFWQTCPPSLLLDISDTLKKVFSFADKAQITMQIGPEPLTPLFLEAVRQAGVNRIVIRTEWEKDCMQNRMLLKTFVNSIGIDLVVSPYSASHLSVKKYSAYINEQGIDHVSLEFSKKCSRKKSIEVYYAFKDALHGQGFEHYEMYSFARPGHRSQQTIGYLTHVPYQGFGVGAFSYYPYCRTRNTTSIEHYLKKGSNKVQGKGSFKENLSLQQQLLEQMMVGLRYQGISMSHIQQYLSLHEFYSFMRKIDYLQKQDMIVLSDRDNTIRLSRAGLSYESYVLEILSY